MEVYSLSPYSKIKTSMLECVVTPKWKFFLIEAVYTRGQFINYKCVNGGIKNKKWRWKCSMRVKVTFLVNWKWNLCEFKINFMWRQFSCFSLSRFLSNLQTTLSKHGSWRREWRWRKQEILFLCLILRLKLQVTKIVNYKK